MSAHRSRGRSTPPLPFHLPAPRDSGQWTPLLDGVRMRLLHPGSRNHARVALLRYEAGACVPWHRHSGDEHVYVLEGEQQDERGRYAAGSYVFNPAQSGHSVQSPRGCLVLIHWLGPVVFEAAPHSSLPVDPSRNPPC
ncbi:cupin domain-containing protein [Algiphilus sp.]|uniref:cupin domain-containing protein n=1 Tax=Algiphilus sp. TaxID=1872431 RepID=UPI0032EBDF86